MLVYMSFGFVLCKAKKGVASHAKTLSALLVYILTPAMILKSFLATEFSLDSLKEIGIFFAATLVIQLLFFLILFLVLRKRYGEAKFRIFTVASVLGNVGFFGLPLITGIFPDEPIVACYSSVFVLSMNLLVFTMGIFMITNDRKYISIKSAILNPTTLSLVVALPLFVCGVDFPEIVDAPINILAGAVTPVCMIILGMRLSVTDLKMLFMRPFVYATCLMKLIVFPLFAYLLVCFIPFFDQIFKISILVLCATPSGAIITSLAELHECEQELSANVVLLTTVLSLVTLPVLLLII